MKVVKVKLRKREYPSGKIALHLDFYPAIRNPRTMQMTRREYLGIYLMKSPRTASDRKANAMKQKQAEAIRAEREIALINEQYGFLDKTKGRMSVLDYFYSILLGKDKKWRIVYEHFYIFTKGKYYFSDVGLRNSATGFRQIEENHLMENIIYNELKARGFNVDVGMVETQVRDGEKMLRKRYEVDFVANQGSRRYYVQSALRMDTPEKEQQEKNSLNHIPDSFRKIIVTRDQIVPYHDEDGVLRIGLFDFLLNPQGLDY